MKFKKFTALLLAALLVLSLALSMVSSRNSP